MITNSYACHERIDALNLWQLYIPASNLERRGWVLRNIPNPETVAQHQIRTALLVRNFSEQIKETWGDILVIQDTLLLHDIAEPDRRVWDITPHCNVSPEEKREREEWVILEMLWTNSYALKLWYDYEDGRTNEWKLAMEFDKLQAILQARLYEDIHGKVWLTEEFYTYSVLKKNQITTPFLVQAALEAYENKPR